MSIKVMNWVWDNSPTKGTELLMLLAIADNAADDGGNAYPSIRTLARKTRLDDLTVQEPSSPAREVERLRVVESEMEEGESSKDIDTVLDGLGAAWPLTPKQR